MLLHDRHEIFRYDYCPGLTFFARHENQAMQT